MQTKLIKAVKVWSDNLDGAVVSVEDYKELRLQMSTGDFHTHKIKYVMCYPETVLEIDWNGDLL